MQESCIFFNTHNFKSWMPMHLLLCITIYSQSHSYKEVPVNLSYFMGVFYILLLFRVNWNVSNVVIVWLIEECVFLTILNFQCIYIILHKSKTKDEITWLLAYTRHSVPIKPCQLMVSRCVLMIYPDCWTFAQARHFNVLHYITLFFRPGFVLQKSTL